MVCFSLALRLPCYAQALLKENKKTRCMLRIMLGVIDQDAIRDIGFDQSSVQTPSFFFSPLLSHFPFDTLETLLNQNPLGTPMGARLRGRCMEVGVVHLILACISVFGHHDTRKFIPGVYQDVLKVANLSQQHMFGGGRASKGTLRQRATAPSNHPNEAQMQGGSQEKMPSYWAKGTGFGTGSTASNWDAAHLLMRQKVEEEHVTNLMKVLASLIEIKGEQAITTQTTSQEDQATQPTKQPHTLPDGLPELLSHSCLVPALSSYLRNDSVLDMACHVPIHRSFLQVLQAVSLHPSLIPILLPPTPSSPPHDLPSSSSSSSISSLLEKMKKCVDTYANRLKVNTEKQKAATTTTTTNPSTSTTAVTTTAVTTTASTSDHDDSEGLAQLIPIIQETSVMVNKAILQHLTATGSISKGARKKASASSFMTASVIGRMSESQEEKYISVMKNLQYDTYRMVVDEDDAIKFSVPHHYEAKVRATGEVSSALRARRLAQETVTLSTSLPLSLGSSVFVRCDEERLDVMKVLITGPTDTPYSNGCFEFDVFFPADYPHSPPLINMQTTGGNSIRFNPNLYNDGKVCLSIINTWHGRPEEKWNSQSSSLLQVLVSIQSLILVHEPYFNEPGYERSKGTSTGTASSREYDANIRQATVRWGILEMIRNPPAVFKQIIHWHLWLKREEILAEVMGWLVEMESFCGEKRVGKNISMSLASLKKHYNQLKIEFDKMEVPEEVGAWEFHLTSSEEEEEDGEGGGIGVADDGGGIFFEVGDKS